MFDQMMISIMGKSMEEAVAKWSEEMGRSGGKMEVEVSDWYQNLVEDVIARATFGGSYADGRPIFQLQAQQMVHATQAYHQIFIPGYRYLLNKHSSTQLYKLIFFIISNIYFNFN